MAGPHPHYVDTGGAGEAFRSCARLSRYQPGAESLASALAGLEELDRVSGGVLEQDLPAAHSRDDLVPEACALLLQRFDEAVQIADVAAETSCHPVTTLIPSTRPAPAPAGRPRAGRPEREDYSARRAEAVRIRAAQPAGSSAPATAITTPASASTTSSGPRYTDR